jgi:hypothetical protein
MKSARFPLIGIVLLLNVCLSGFASPSRSYLIEATSLFGGHPSKALLVICCLVDGNFIDVEIPPDRGCAAYLRAHLSGVSFIVRDLAIGGAYIFSKVPPNSGRASSRARSIRGLVRRSKPTRLAITCVTKPPIF